MKCSDCKWCDERTSTSNGLKRSVYTCRRNPPSNYFVPSREILQSRGWPRVEARDWCGKFVDKKEPEPNKWPLRLLSRQLHNISFNKSKSDDTNCLECKHSVEYENYIWCESLGVAHKNNAIKLGHCALFEKPEPEIPESKIIPEKCINCAYYPDDCNMHFVCDRYMHKV